MTLDSALLTEMLRRILRIRFFEEAVIDLKNKGDIPGGAHLCIGHEATLVGSCLAGGDKAYMTGTHRSHGHPIAKGADIKGLMAELMARTTGVCKGKGGSLHLADFSVGSLGESGIVAGNIPHATGAALSAKLQQQHDQLTLAFFGDAATSHGAFHESVNMAAAWKLPVVFICENNLYGVSIPTVDVTPVKDLAERAAGYNIPGMIVDGQDPVAVFEVVTKACERARAGQGPSFIECKTYRFREHAEMLHITGSYREDEEIKLWREERDPVQNFPLDLVERGILSQQQVDDIIAEVQSEVAAAIQFGYDSPRPVAEDAFRDLYCDTRVSGNAIRSFEVDRPEPEDKREINYIQAINEAQAEELMRDDKVVVFGQDVRCNLWGGTGFAEYFDTDRVFDAPLSETAIVGGAIGMAMTGMRPVVDMTIANFVHVAMDQFVNQAAKCRYMFGGQATIPVTYRAAMMYGMSIGAHHTDRPYPMFMNNPGLKVIVPSCPFDAKGLLKAAIRDDNPVMCFEDSQLWLTQQHVPEEDYIVPLGLADIKRRGSDITIVAIASGVRAALEAAEDLGEKGVSVEVLDPRSLVPLDIDTIVESVCKTGHLIVVDPAHKTCGAGAEICSLVMEQAFESLKKAPVRINTPDTQIPFAPEMETPLFPNRERVTKAAEQLMQL